MKDRDKRRHDLHEQARSQAGSAPGSVIADSVSVEWVHCVRFAMRHVRHSGDRSLPAAKSVSAKRAQVRMSMLENLSIQATLRAKETG